MGEAKSAGYVRDGRQMRSSRQGHLGKIAIISATNRERHSQDQELGRPLGHVRSGTSLLLCQQVMFSLSDHNKNALA